MSKQGYIKENLAWIEEKAKESDVVALRNGVYYKPVRKGKNDGIHPSPRSIVTVHYTARNLIAVKAVLR